jgi:hypothetical protein
MVIAFPVVGNAIINDIEGNQKKLFLVVKKVRRLHTLVVALKLMALTEKYQFCWDGSPK